ncbi:MAG: substrate-binding domain-containing protein [Coriobacteriia bacterium]|nr:substrate-binding domain-containing protein [Coriobacteriia bacterium]
MKKDVIGSPPRFVKLALVTSVSLVMLFALLACGGTTAEQGDGTQDAGSLRLATTTSTKDSGLLEAIIPVFEAQTGISVEVISVGSGEAIALGESGEADVLLVHSPGAEKSFVEEGHADDTGRLDVMYNDFIIIGPVADPAGIASSTGNDAVASFTAIAQQEAVFISRNDNSGTHSKENSIWEKAGIEPDGSWYVKAGDGMGAVIAMANEMLGYTLADRATWLSNAASTELKIVCEKDPTGILFNQYGVICVNPNKNSSINHDGAVVFQQWITSPEGQALIAEYGITLFGEALFTPNADQALATAA